MAEERLRLQSVFVGKHSSPNVLFYCQYFSQANDDGGVWLVRRVNQCDGWRSNNGLTSVICLVSPGTNQWDGFPLSHCPTNCLEPLEDSSGSEPTTPGTHQNSPNPRNPKPTKTHQKPSEPPKSPSEPSKILQNPSTP